MLLRAAKIGVALIPMIASAAGCESLPPCTPTMIEAKDSAVADLRRPLRSAVLQARLTAGGRALAGKTVEFRVEGGSNDEIGDATTGGAGVARRDLKTQPAELVDTTVAGGYRASFRGDATYCPSTDSARFTLAK